MWVTGFAGEGPMRAGIAVADLSAGLYAAAEYSSRSRARALRRRPVGADVVATVANRDDGFPGGALSR